MSRNYTTFTFVLFIFDTDAMESAVKNFTSIALDFHERLNKVDKKK